MTGAAVAAPAGVLELASVGAVAGSSAPRCRVTIKPIRVVYFNRQLETTARMGVGHRAVCSCDWRGPKRRTVAAARFDRADHLAAADDELESGDR